MIPFGVVSIEWMTFENCTSLTDIVIPTSVTSIGDDAFNGCKGLTGITIPSSVTSIGGGAFTICIYNHRTTKTNQKYPSVNL